MLEQSDVQREILSKLETLVDDMKQEKAIAAATNNRRMVAPTAGSGRYELDANGNMVEKKSTGVAKAGMILGIITAALLVAGAGGGGGCGGCDIGD